MDIVAVAAKLTCTAALPAVGICSARQALGASPNALECIQLAVHVAAMARQPSALQASPKPEP